MQTILVLDVGKTNVKLHVLNSQQESLQVHNLDNTVSSDGLYPHADVDAIWSWLLEIVSKVVQHFDVSAISITTHGATAALVDPEKEGDGLVLPVMDYEWEDLDTQGDYDRERPSFSETCSPNLPAGLNLGRQLYWQQKNYPEQFNAAQSILMYPQYWAWRLSGRQAGEVTSLGCHTDLWAPEKQDYSSLVDRQGWRDLLPPIVPAYEVVGTVLPRLAEKTGLRADCKVHAGIHDSNANLLRYLHSRSGKAFCLVSSGTWVICMAVTDKAISLNENRDMLANVDVNGNSVPCIRFMGGREYAQICHQLGEQPGDQARVEDINKIIAKGVFALPDFSAGSGPFGHRKAAITGAGVNANALASLYCALMTDYCLDLLEVDCDVIIAGSFLQNPLLCALIAQLRNQPVLLSSDTAGTVRGAGQLTDFTREAFVSLDAADSSVIPGLADYAVQWRTLAEKTE